MRDPLPAARWALCTWRRATTAALLVLQVLVAFSALTDRSGPIRPLTHTHDQQRHHGRPHDDANCALCTARTQVAEATEPPAVERPQAGATSVFQFEYPVVPPRTPTGVPASRAPPVLS